MDKDAPERSAPHFAGNYNLPTVCYITIAKHNKATILRGFISIVVFKLVGETVEQKEVGIWKKKRKKQASG